MVDWCMQEIRARLLMLRFLRRLKPKSDIHSKNRLPPPAMSTLMNSATDHDRSGDHGDGNQPQLDPSGSLGQETCENA